MACSLHPASEAVAAVAAATVRPPAMTRCECAQVSFQEVARRMRDEGASADEACRRTGCGRLCTACVPDLERFLASR